MITPTLRCCGFLTILALAACNKGDSAPTSPSSSASTSPDAIVLTEPAAMAGATAPRSAGRTVSASTIGVAAGQSAEELDTTTAGQKAQAAAPSAGGQKLGTTIASLGDPSQPGFWIKTPLVGAESQGRIVNPANGKSANVRLIPLGGPASGGSQVSLPALQMLGVSLTDLPALEVYSG
ncbi:hypothetical protein [Paracoccus ravus]|uniref:hypothetical protein n=1 Tax=Paracoccus ravus TaxID=2447760 RepID=UPI00106E1AE2|nr:hypothetical protein [Paracoccus ravus]